MTVTVPPVPGAVRIDTFARLALANIGVAVAEFGVAAAMAIMQALSRANLDLLFRSAGMYYMSVTAHGTLMAIVVAYGYPIWQHLQMPRFGSPGFSPF